MTSLKTTGFGEEYTKRKYTYYHGATTDFKGAAHLFVNSIITGAVGLYRVDKNRILEVRLKDGTVINQFELKLVRSLPTPSPTTPGLYYVRDIAAGHESSDIIIRITRSGNNTGNNKLLIETTDFDGYFMTTKEFGDELRTYLGVEAF